MTSTLASGTIKITVGEAFSWVVEKLRGAALDVVPREDQINILIDRMRGETNVARAAYHKALAAECQIQNPEHPKEGELPRLRTKLERIEERGQKWGAELKEGPSRKRKAELEGLLLKLDGEASEVEAAIASNETLLKTRQETTALRRKSYQNAKADLDQLVKVAPAIVEKIAALKESQQERLRAVADSGKGSGSQAGALVAQLERELGEAESGSSAAEIIESEEATDDDFDLDEIEASEAAEEASSERIARWKA